MLRDINRNPTHTFLNGFYFRKFLFELFVTLCEAINGGKNNFFDVGLKIFELLLQLFLLTLLFRERMPFRDSIRMAREPGSLPPLPSTLVELPWPLSNMFLFWPDWPRPTLMAAGLWVKPSKNGCFKAWAAVIRFYGSKVSIFIIRSMADSDAFGII